MTTNERLEVLRSYGKIESRSGAKIILALSGPNSKSMAFDAYGSGVTNDACVDNLYRDLSVTVRLMVRYVEDDK